MITTIIVWWGKTYVISYLLKKSTQKIYNKIKTTYIFVESKENMKHIIMEIIDDI